MLGAWGGGDGQKRVWGAVEVHGGPDERIAQLAELQKGRVSREQLLAAGLRPSSIDRRVRSGRLHRVHRAVYAAGHLAGVELGEEAAALLAAGDGAMLGFRSAIVLWGLRPPTGHRVPST